MSEELADLALATARLAAELVRERRAAGVAVAATKSSDVDVVTQADRDSEELIRRTLRAARPDDAFLGEEGDDEPGTSGVRWVIDPIDGTVNFLYGLPQYAVSIAAEVDGTAVAGVVLNVATGTEYVARRDDAGRAHATRDGVPLGPRAAVPLDKTLVATGFSYDREVRRHQVAAWLDLLPRVRDLRRLGSCALDLCAVAEGTVDAYLEEGVNLWDFAAGALVAEAAGCRSEQLPGVGGRTLLVCAPEASYDVLEAATVAAGFARGTGE